MRMLKLYLDTNIYIDYFDGRVDNLRPLGKFAFNLLKRTLECEFQIIISSLVLDELTYNTYKENMLSLIKDLKEKDLKEKDKLMIIEVNEEDVKNTIKIKRERKTTHNDTLHAVLANRIKADFLVTRNLKDFEELQDLVKVVLPENL